MKNSIKIVSLFIIALYAALFLTACTNEPTDESAQNEHETIQQDDYEAASEKVETEQIDYDKTQLDDHGSVPEEPEEVETERIWYIGLAWVVPPVLEYEHIYHCCADFSAAPGGMAVDVTTGQLTSEYAVLHGDHGPLGRGWVYDPELSLLGFGGIGGDYSGISLRPIDEWADSFAQWGDQFRLMMVELVDSSVRNVSDSGGEYLGDDAYSGKFAVMHFDTFVTDFIFDGGGTSGGAVLEHGTIPMHTGGKWGMIDRYGRIAIPFVFDHILRIDEDTAFAQYDGKYGILDLTLTSANMGNL